MKKRRLTIILIIILLIFAAVYYIATNIMNSSDNNTGIFNLESGSTAKIRIVSQNISVGFEKHDEQWVMVEPAAYNIDSEMVQRLTVKLENLNALRVIEKRAANLNKYGLEDPKMTVTLSLQNGTEKALLIGEETASKYQYYVKDAQKDTVYTLALSDVEAFGGGDPSVFRDRNLFNIDKDKINVFCLYRNDIREMLLLKYDTGKWEFSEPFKTNAKSDAVNDIIKKIGGLKIKDFVEEDPSDLNKYGLDNSFYSVEIGDQNGMIQKISFGNIDKAKKEAFIRLDDAGEIYTVSVDEFSPEDVIIADLLNEAPLSVAIDSVKTIIINDEGSVSEFNRDTTKPDDDVFTFNDETVIKDDFIALYVNMMALTSDGYDAGYDERIPEMTIIYKSMQGNDTIKLELSARDDKSYFLTVDDNPLPFYVAAQKVDLVRRWLAKIIENRT